jgi:hypothetical protein
VTEAATDAVPRSTRVFVGVLFALLLVPGLVGFDAWPLTAWRLFSADRGNTQSRWEVAVVTPGGATEPLDLDELPIAFRNAEWILAGLPSAGAGDARREEVCQALLAGVREHAEPDAAGLVIVRNRRTMEATDEGFEAVDDREAVHTCEAS